MMRLDVSWSAFFLAVSLSVASSPEGMVLVPAGPFVMGADDGGADEAPAHLVYVSAYYIDRNEVTNASFARYVRDAERFDQIEGPWFRYCAQGCLDLIGHYQERHGVALQELEGGASKTETHLVSDQDLPRWRSAVAALSKMLGDNGHDWGRISVEEIAAGVDVRRLIEKQAAEPVRGVTWRDASAFASWSGKRLPTEAEWEKAARGTDRRSYPWGSNWDAQRCIWGDRSGPAPVGGLPDGAGPYGCLDMAGNVWEWVADWYGQEYYARCEGARDARGPKGLPDGQLPWPAQNVDLLRTAQQGRESDTRKVIRGGGWAGPELQVRFNARCTRRLWSNPSYWHPDVGFRCAMAAD